MAIETFNEIIEGACIAMPMSATLLLEPCCSSHPTYNVLVRSGLSSIYIEPTDQQHFCTSRTAARPAAVDWYDVDEPSQASSIQDSLAGIFESASLRLG
jgi:hypothetical protein